MAREDVIKLLESFPLESYIDSLPHPDIPTGDKVIDCLHIEHYQALLTNFLNWTYSEWRLARSENDEQARGIADKCISDKMGMVVFAATTMEAAINHYGKLHEIKCVDRLERKLKTLEKWKKYPKEAENRKLSGHILGYVKRISQLRNQVVHPKSNWTTLEKIRKIPYFAPPQGAYLLNIVNDSLRELYSQQECDWLHENYSHAKDWKKGVVLS